MTAGVKVKHSSLVTPATARPRALALLFGTLNRLSSCVSRSTKIKMNKVFAFSCYHHCINTSPSYFCGRGPIICLLLPIAIPLPEELPLFMPSPPV